MQQPEHFRQQALDLLTRLLVKHRQRIVILRREVLLEWRIPIAEPADLSFETGDVARQFSRQRACLLRDGWHQQRHEPDDGAK